MADELNDALFEAFNLAIGPRGAVRGHEWISEVDGPEPEALAEDWIVRLPEGSEGRVLWNVDASDYAEVEDTYDISMESLLAPEGPPRPLAWKTLAELGYRVKIHTITYRPRGVRDLSKYRGILAGHGVPTSAQWKSGIGRRLGKKYLYVAFDMLGMGRSTMVWDYRTHPTANRAPHESWQFKYDVDYVGQLVDAIRTTHRVGGLAYFAEDWGTAQLLRYLNVHPKPGRGGRRIDFAVFGASVWNDGWFVFEIGTIGNLGGLLLPRGARESSDAYRARIRAFDAQAAGLPAQILGIEKSVMVKDSAKFNQWTEPTRLGQYRDARYQNGNFAQDYHVNQYRLAALAVRSSQLGGLQLAPRHSRLNPTGVDFASIQVPIHVVWGDDQMMPASQLEGFPYLFPNARVHKHRIHGKLADHFFEIDQPEIAAELYFGACQLEWGVRGTPVHLGGNSALVYKGTEVATVLRLSRLYGVPEPYDKTLLKDLAEPIEKESSANFAAIREKRRARGGASAQKTKTKPAEGALVFED